MMKRLPAILCAIAVGTAYAGLAWASDPCAAPDELTGGLAALPHVAAVLKPGATLDVLTIGSATVFGPGESLMPGTVTGQALGLGPPRPQSNLPPATDAAFPLQMASALRAATPNLQVNVTIRGGRGMTASDMLAIVKTELSQHHYQLVIWQTGTVDAVRNMPSDDFLDVLSNGADAVHEAGADLVLVNPQYSRFLHSNAQLDDYTLAMQQVAAMPDTMLFPRYELMRYWVSEGQIDLERTARSQRLKTVEQLHACIGAKLAQMIEDGAKMPPS